MTTLPRFQSLGCLAALLAASGGLAGCYTAQRALDQKPPEIHRRQGVARVERIDYHGWHDAWRIRNDACELVIVPQVNRVMYFGLIGNDNALWNNSALEGQVVSADDHEWHNFGGDRVWPTQQNWWGRYADPKGWPPDYAFDVAPASAEVIPGGVRTTSQKSRYFGTRTVREFVMDPYRAMVVVRQWYQKEDGKPIPMTVWTVMQTPTPDYAMIARGRVIDGKPYKMLSNSIIPGHLEVHASVVTITNDSQTPMKIGTVLDPTGVQDDWVAAVHGREMLLESRRLQHGATYPDGGCPAEIYTAPAQDGSYVEMEMLGPLKNLSAGSTLRDDMVWQLVPLTDRQARDPDQAAGVARKAHRAALRALQ